MKFVHRLIVLLGLLFTIHTVTLAITRSMVPKGIELPATELAEMPSQFGDWMQNNSLNQSPDIESAAGADRSIWRWYQHAESKEAVTAYTAVWTEYWDGLPHIPTECYRGLGSDVIETRGIELNRPNGQSSPAAMMRLERDGIPVHVLFWYQLGDDTIWDRDQMRKVLWKHRGEKNWPPLVKVMLDIRGLETPAAEPMLLDLAEHILNWTLTEL